MAEKRSLRRVLIWLVVAAGVAPLAVATLVILIWLLPALQQQVVAGNRALATALATQTEKTLLPSHAALHELATRVEGYERQGSLQTAFDTLVVASDLFEAVYLVGADDKLRTLAVPSDTAIRRGDFLGIDLSGYAVLRQARQAGSGVWSEVYRSPISDHSVVAAVVPAGKRLLVAELSLSRLSDFVARLAGQGATMFILDERGLVVAHPDARLAAQQVNFSHLPIWSLRNEIATMRFGFEQGEVIATRVPIRDLGWQVLVMQPLATVQRPVFVTLWTLLALSAVGTALALWLGFLLARRIAARFERLAVLSEQLAQGGYPEHWPEQDMAEAEVLNSGLQRMASAVREREQALRELNQTLEDRVAERSARLQQAQESLDRSERLAALGSLVAGVAHELNTPIGNGLMTATALQERTRAFGERPVTGLRRTELEAFVTDCGHAGDLIVRNLFRASELVNSFKQVAVDQTSSQRRDFDLAAVVSEIALTMGPLLRKQNCSLQLDLEAGVLLDSYPGPLGQVLVNLINNAMLHAYDGQGGVIEVMARHGETGWVEIVVSDHGAGIPAGNLKRIFDPFFTTKLGQGGSGLGLHICYNIINTLLGGSIAVSSEEAVGTRFTLLLPLHAPGEQPASGAAEFR